MEKQLVYFVALVFGILIGWFLRWRSGHYQQPIDDSRKAYLADHPAEAAVTGFLIAMGLFNVWDLLVGLNNAATLGPVLYSLAAGLMIMLHALSIRHGRAKRQQGKSESDHL